MRSVWSFEWPAHVSYKREREDACVVKESERAHVAVVADGVTRLQDKHGKYPYHSPATKAANVAALTIAKWLVSSNFFGEVVIRQAFSNGNVAVKRLNEELGFWDKCDYLTKDFAGTVAACVVESNGQIHCANIGDCGVAHFSSKRKLLWHSDDDVAKARPFFPKIEEVGLDERYIRVRRDFRNKPAAKHLTFGVLTGEPEALFYVKVESRSYILGDVVAVYSDGLAPFVLEDIDFQHLLVTGDQKQIQQYVADRSSSKLNPDEKTLILLRL